jgi:hypothetical protein
MTDYWITLQVSPQRTADVRVSAESFPEAVEKFKAKDGFEVIAIRPCLRHQESKEDDSKTD